MQITLEVRQCQLCVRIFKVMPHSPVVICSRICEEINRYNKKIINKEKWPTVVITLNINTDRGDQLTAGDVSGAVSATWKRSRFIDHKKNRQKKTFCVNTAILKNLQGE